MYRYIDNYGTFQMDNPEETSDLYFPIANEAGVMSSITPTLNGDLKLSQNEFLLAPVSVSDLHNNRSSRNFWVRIKSKGTWSATGVSALQESNRFTDKKEETKLTAGFLWQQMDRVSKEYGISSRILNFVPANDDKVELMSVTIKNESKESMEITPIVAIPMYARSASNIRDHRDVTSMLHRIQTTEYGVVVDPTLTFDERGHKVNEIFYGIFAGANNEAPVGFYPTVSDFIGEGGNFLWPQAAVKGDMKLRSVGYQVNGVEAMGAIEFATTTLAPQEEKTYYIALGFGRSMEQIVKESSKYLNQAGFEQAFTEQKEFWKKKVSVKFSTGDEKFDAFMQWVNVQPHLRKIYGCSFLPHHDYGKGGRGWRDLWQDCLALLLIDPTRVRQLLLDNFGGVRMDGTNATIIGSKQGEFIADRNNITRVWMDHGAWPFVTIHMYLNTSGDYKFLLEKSPYFKDAQVVRGTDKDERWSPEDGSLLKESNGNIYEGTVLEHLLVQNLTSFYDVGEHNEIKLRGADWNDALDMATKNGESVAFTNLYAKNLEDLAAVLMELQQYEGIKEIEIAKELMTLTLQSSDVFGNVAKKNEILTEYCKSVKYTMSGEKVTISCERLASLLKEKSEWMKEHIRKTEWLTNKDGYSWFNGYYDDHCNRVEGDFPNGTRIMLTGQVFSIMAGTATTEMVEKITQAVDQYLYDESIGGYKLNTDFKEVKLDMGRMFGFAYGQKENGAVFAHMAVMYANALYQRGFSLNGYKALKALYTHSNNFEASKIYPGVAEYYDSEGRGRYHYLTGSASWFLLTVLTEMFGIKGDKGDLCIIPHLAAEQFNADKEASVNTVFHNIPFHIVIKNEALKEVGQYEVVRMIVDGKEVSKDNLARISKAELETMDSTIQHSIVVELG